MGGGVLLKEPDLGQCVTLYQRCLVALCIYTNYNTILLIYKQFTSKGLVISQACSV